MPARRPSGLRAVLALVTVAVAGALVVTAVAVGPAAGADAPPPLPASATREAARWQPAMDYDADSCYSAPAIGPDGYLAQGLEPRGSMTRGCRDPGDLGSANAYVRTECRGPWCAHLYAYYFEKDQSLPSVTSGHRHDWEHVVVWVRGGRAGHVSVSAHGGYDDTRPADRVRWEGSHPKVVYHKDGPLTRAMRFAEPHDDDVENGSGRWHRPDLVGWDAFPPGVREALVAADFGSATLDLRDDRFPAVLARDAADAGIPW